MSFQFPGTGPTDLRALEAVGLAKSKVGKSLFCSRSSFRGPLQCATDAEDAGYVHVRGRIRQKVQGEDQLPGELQRVQPDGVEHQHDRHVGQQVALALSSQICIGARSACLAVKEMLSCSFLRTPSFVATYSLHSS